MGPAPTDGEVEVPLEHREDLGGVGVDAPNRSGVLRCRRVLVLHKHGLGLLELGHRLTTPASEHARVCQGGSTQGPVSDPTSHDRTQPPTPPNTERPTWAHTSTSAHTQEIRLRDGYRDQEFRVCGRVVGSMVKQNMMGVR